MRQLRSILLLPGVVLVLMPALLTWLTGVVNIGWGLAAPLNWLPILLGALLMVLGLLLMVRTIRLLASEGDGTLAPWDPTDKLVVRGIYRYVRNPMITGVLCVLLGEVVFLGSLPIFAWFTLALVVNLIYMPLSEEPGLEKRFGEDYRQYKRNVPAWIPSRTPWENSSRDDREG